MRLNALDECRQDVRDDANGLEAAEAGMAEKSAEFRGQGRELYPQA